MKKIISKILVMMLMATPMLLESCDTSNEDNAVGFGTGVSITGPGVKDHELTIEADQSVQLKAYGDRWNGYIWTSFDESIATVNDDGVLTGVSAGRVRITAYSNTPIANGDYIWVTVIGKSMKVNDDALDQSLAD